MVKLVKSGGKNCIMRCKIAENETEEPATPPPATATVAATVTAEITQEETKAAAAIAVSTTGTFPDWLPYVLIAL